MTPKQYDLGVTFFVTATGSQSGRHATTTFTDANKTWTGDTATDWNTPTNWNNNTLPATGDDIIIPAGMPRYPVITSAIAAKTVELATGAGTPPSLTVSGGTLTVAGNFDIANVNGTVTLSGGAISVTAGNITIAGTLNISAGTFLTSRDIVVSSGGRVNVSGTGTLHLANAIGTAPTNLLEIVTPGRRSLSPAARWTSGISRRP